MVTSPMFYKKELCADKPTSFLPQPVDQHRFLYLLYDTTHIFKCIYHSFQKHILSNCSKFEELTISLDFRHIIDFIISNCQNLSKAYDFIDECLNPQAIEKTKATVAARIFGESFSSTDPAITRNKSSWLYTDRKHSIRSTWKAIWKISPT